MEIETYTKKEIEEEFKKTSLMTSVALAVRKNRKDMLGTSWADATKCGLTETALTEVSPWFTTDSYHYRQKVQESFLPFL